MIAKISKKPWFWQGKMGSKIELFEFWRVLVLDLNFRLIFYQFVIDFSNLKSLKIVLPPRRDAYFCKIDVFALNQKNDQKNVDFGLQNPIKIDKNRLKNVFRKLMDF